MKLLPLLGFAVMLCACTSVSVLEQTENKVGTLTSADEYLLRPLTVNFKAPEAWGTTPEQWNSWVALWKTEFEREIRGACRKKLDNIGSEARLQRGYVVECDIYEMNYGGFAGVGGKAYARGRLLIRDSATGSVLYDGKLQGTATTQTKAADRLTAAVGDLGANAAVILMQGG